DDVVGNDLRPFQVDAGAEKRRHARKLFHPWPGDFAIDFGMTGVAAQFGDAIAVPGHGIGMGNGNPRQRLKGGFLGFDQRVQPSDRGVF
ncbi:hypothetical protein DF186_17245, partial [Enterococcus hirae]